MSISLDSIIQTNTGSGFGTTATVTLPAGTTAGNAVLIALFYRGTSAFLFTTAGFATDTAGSSTTSSVMYRKSNVGAGATSWTSDTAAVAESYAWVAMEVADLDLTQPLDSTPTGASNATATTSLNVASVENYCYEGLVFCMHGAYNSTNNTTPTWSGQNNGYVEVASVGRSEASIAMGMSVSAKVVGDSVAGGGVLDCSATSSQTADLVGNTVVYVAETGKRVVNLDLLAGFEWGTTAGWTNGLNPFKIVDTVVGSPAIVSTSPRSGSYCLELASTAAAENLQWDGVTGALSSYAPFPISTPVMRISVYFPTSLPSGDVELFALGPPNASTTGSVTVRYRTASQKIGVQITGTSPATSGTEVLSASTVAANTWYSIDVRMDMRTTAWKAAWQIDNVDQTTATHTQTIVGEIWSMRIGWGSSTTATVRYDDFALSRLYANYPLGDIHVYPLKVDPAGTPTVTGSSSNFSTFTSNGTLNATFSVTTARDAVDDIPPTLGGSADGFVQDTSSGTDYVEFPMQTRDVITNHEFIRGVRAIFCGWAAGTQAATIGFGASVPGYVDDLDLAAISDYNFDTSSTPGWVASMVRVHSASQNANAKPFRWTPTRLDDLRTRVGFSTDASPVIGVHAILAEVAVRTPDVLRVAEIEGVTLDTKIDGDSGVVAAVTLTAPAGSGAAGTYTVRGVTVNRTASAGTSDVYTVGGTDIEDCTFLSCEPT